MVWIRSVNEDHLAHGREMSLFQHSLLYVVPRLGQIIFQVAFCSRKLDKELEMPASRIAGKLYYAHIW